MDAAQRDLPRDALWQIVHNVCVPGQSEHHDPQPCLHVDLDGGIESGFAILRDPRGGTQFLLIPTTRISGIESPIVRGPNATNYFASAWEARTEINDALHLKLSRDQIGLAINLWRWGAPRISCTFTFLAIRTDVSEALHRNEGKIEDHWAPFNVPLSGQRVPWPCGCRANTWSLYNPFTLLGGEIAGRGARYGQSHARRYWVHPGGRN